VHLIFILLLLLDPTQANHHDHATSQTEAGSEDQGQDETEDAFLTTTIAHAETGVAAEIARALIVELANIPIAPAFVRVCVVARLTVPAIPSEARVSSALTLWCARHFTIVYELMILSL